MPRTNVTGTVVSTTDKTISVRVDRSKTHPVYKKRYNVNKKYFAHDEKNEANVGDRVRLIEVPPISRNKRWKLAKIVERNIDTEPVV